MTSSHARSSGSGLRGRKAEREAEARRLALETPYAVDNEASQRRAMARAAEPRNLTAYVRWCRWAYKQEPPVRLHTRETGPDGNPRWSGDFYKWITGADSGLAACGTDVEGYYRTPFRCALYVLHGRFEDTEQSAMAHLCLDIATNEFESALLIAAQHGIGPQWVQPIVLRETLRRLWDLYAPLPR